MADYFELLIPLFAIGIGPLIVWVIFRYTHKNQLEVQKTIRAIVESGQEVPPDIMESLNEVKRSTPEARREKDLRWGVIFTAIGIALLLAALPGIFAGQWDDIWDGAWFVMIFLGIGIARLVLWKLGSGVKDSDRD